MKTQLALFFLMVLFLPALGVQTANAQSNETIRCDVPFDFYAGTQKLPAGTYYFKVDAGESNVEITDGVRNGMFLMRMYLDNAKSSSPALVFDHVGDNYFLKTMQTLDEDLTFAVKNSEHRFALNGSAIPVVVAAKPS